MEELLKEEMEDKDEMERVRDEKEGWARVEGRGGKGGKGGREVSFGSLSFGWLGRMLKFA